MAITYTEYTEEYGSTTGDVANPARGQLNREDIYFAVCPRSRLRVWFRETADAKTVVAAAIHTAAAMAVVGFPAIGSLLPPNVGEFLRQRRQL